MESPQVFPLGQILLSVGPATTQNLVVKFDGEICGGVLVENASDDFPKQNKLENLLPNFDGSAPPISPKTSPTSLWKSLVLMSVAAVRIGDREPRTIPTKDLLHQVVFLGVVCELSEPRKKAKYAPPPVLHSRC